MNTNRNKTIDRIKRNTLDSFRYKQSPMAYKIESPKGFCKWIKAEDNFNVREGVLITQTAVYMLS